MNPNMVIPGDGGPGHVAVPASLVQEAVKAKRAALALHPLQKPVGIPFHRVRTPAEAHVFARMLMAHSRMAGNDMSDQATPQLAEARAHAVLKQSLNNLDVHLAATGEDRALRAAADITVSSTEYWASLNKEFRELMAEADATKEPSAGMAMCGACNTALPTHYKFCPHCGANQNPAPEGESEPQPEDE